METAGDPFEELTSLYLGDPPPSRTSPAVEAKASWATGGDPKVTIAVCGNLPVMAGLWVTQFADQAAASGGPTGLLRLEGGRCSVELLRAPMVERPSEGVAMTRATAEMAATIRRWIVCVDGRDAASAVRAGADEVVVLTSGDQPAIVEAFRLVKAARGRAIDPSSVDVGVVIVGADEATAARAGATLKQMAATHLDRPLSVVETIRRLDVVEDSQRIAFDESSRGAVEELVGRLREVLAEVATTVDEHRPPTLRLTDRGEDEPLHVVSEDGLDLEVDPSATFEAIFGPLDDGPPPVPSTEDAASRRPERPIDRGRQRPRHPASVRLSPTPATRTGRTAFIGLEDYEDESATSSAMSPAIGGSTAGAGSRPVIEWTPSGGLVELIGGLRRVDWPFVTAPGVECGVDDAGGVHLVCLSGDQGQLDVAAAWARRYHRQIAGIAGVPVEPAGEPRRHVVTANAPAVADLHRTGVHLHLLVESGDRIRTIPLNDESNRSMPD